MPEDTVLFGLRSARKSCLKFGSPKDTASVSEL